MPVYKKDSLMWPPEGNIAFYIQGCIKVFWGKKTQKKGSNTTHLIRRIFTKTQNLIWVDLSEEKIEKKRKKSIQKE